MMKRLLLICIAAPLCLFAETNIPKVVVSARGYESPVSKTPGGIGTVESRTVFENQPASVPNLGKNLSGVWKNSDGAWGSDINIRGLSRDSVVVLVDGARVETANAINARLGFIDPASIERIEVLKGPVSSLYGSGSIGGVVNIITKGAGFQPLEKTSGGFSSVWKSNPQGFTLSGWGSYANASNYLYAGQTFRDFDSYKDGDGDTMRNSQFHDRQTTLKAGHRFGDDYALEFQAQYYEGRNIGIPAGNDSLPAAGQRITYPATRRGLFDLTHTWLPNSERWEQSELTLYYHFNDRRVVIDNFPGPAPVAEVRPGANHETFGGRWENRIRIEDHTLVAGLDIWRRTYEGFRERELKSGTVLFDHPLPDSSFLSAGGFMEDQWQASDRLTFSAGGRADWIEVRNDPVAGFWEEQTENDISWNAHLGATYALSESLSAKGIIARGYRAATLEERYSFINLSGGGILYGDPSLDPEESLFTEWGLDWHGDTLGASVSAFFNRLDNLIVIEDIGAGPDRRYANVREAEIFGVEADAEWRVSKGWKTYGNLSWLDGRDKTTGDDLPNIAPLSGLIGLRGEHPDGLWGSADIEFAAKQNQTPADTDEAAAWQTVNLRLGYDFATKKASHTVYIGIDNLFDEQYSNYLSTDRNGSVVLYEPGRCFTAAWQVEF